MNFRRFDLLRLLVFMVPCIVGLGSSGCATNPATGKSQVMLISEQQEIDLGRQEDANTVANFGLYDDVELQEYVSEIGLSLARDSERPSLPWEVKVLDDPVVNAMALPGGYVYVTRGILGYLNSEAELATVLGHEVGHVTARHSANQMSKAQLAGLGLGVGMMVEPSLLGLSDLAQMGTQALFLKFSRDDERQADELGMRYMVDDGYDPRESPEVFDMLRRVSAQGGAGRIPGWMSTHPDPDNRSSRMRSLIATSDRDFEQSRIGREEYLRQIDGLTWGEDPREGYFDGARFIHPALAFQLVLPPGWKSRNSKQAVAAISPNQDAVVYLTLAGSRNLDEAANKFASQEGVSTGRFSRGEFDGLSAMWSDFNAYSGQTSIKGRIAFVSYEGRIYRLTGYTSSAQWASRRKAIDGSIQSFARLRDRNELSVQPRRISIVQIERAMTLQEFYRAYPSSVPLETVALMNDAQPGTRFSEGDFLKRVLGGK